MVLGLKLQQFFSGKTLTICFKWADLWPGVEQTSQGDIEWPWLQHKGESEQTVPMEVPFNDQSGGVRESQIQNYQPMPGFNYSNFYK